METVLSDIEKQLVSAFRSGEYDKATQAIRLTRERELATQAESEARKRREDVDRQLSTLTGNIEPANDFKGRKIRLKVTYGSLQHSYLLVTRALGDGVLSATEKLKVQVPATGESFTTVIYLRNKHLNERHGIRRFYKAADVKSGGFVLLEEIAPGEWRLTKCAPPGSE